MDGKIVSLVSQSMSTVVLNLILFLFFNNLYHAKYKLRLIYAGSFFIATILMIFVNQLDLPIVNIIYGFVSFNIICNLLYNTNLKQSFLYNSLLILVLFISDIVTVLFWTFIKNEEFNKVLETHELMCISNLMNVLIMFLAYRVCLAFFSKKELRSIRVKEAITIVMFTTFEIFVIYNLSRLETNGSVFIIIMFGFS